MLVQMCVFAYSIVCLYLCVHESQKEMKKVNFRDIPRGSRCVNNILIKNEDESNC